jgi:hypothetical protein
MRKGLDIMANALEVFRVAVVKTKELSGMEGSFQWITHQLSNEKEDNNAQFNVQQFTKSDSIERLPLQSIEELIVPHELKQLDSIDIS